MASSNKTWVNNQAPEVEDVDLNGFQNENNNLITSSGQSLNTGDSLQTVKAVSKYASVGDFYIEGGGSAADAYVLEGQGAMQEIFEYVDGSSIRFRVTNANTGASTININGIGVKNLEVLGSALSLGGLVAGEIAEVVFNLSDDKFYLQKDAFQIKMLTANVTTNVVMTDLSFTLTVGKTYQIMLNAETATSTVDKDIAILIKDGATSISQYRTFNDSTVGGVQNSAGMTMIRTMTNTALTFTASSASVNSIVVGNGSLASTHVIVMELGAVAPATVL